MLRKRNRSVQKDQHHMCEANSEHYCQSHHALGHNNIKGHSILNVPCLFVGLGPKGLLDSDSVRSPTSPLDARGLSNLGNPVRKPRSSPYEGHQRSWDCCKVGLGIVESLEDCSRFSGKILQSPESKKISLSPQMMIKAPNCQLYRDSLEISKSLPKDFCKAPYVPQNRSVTLKGESESTVLFEIGGSGPEHELFGRSRSCSLDSCSPLKSLSALATSFTDSDTDYFAVKDVNIQVSSPPHFIGGSRNSDTFPPTKLNSNTLSICSSNEFIKSLSASEIELSEDYTCVISYGPNPKTTHIFGDCVLETHSNAFKNHFKNEEEKGGNPLGNNKSGSPNPYPSSDFLSFCHHCNKELEEGKDIYIYGGEKAFCSLTCRAMEIMMDEELEKSNTNPPCETSPRPKLGELLFETGILTVT